MVQQIETRRELLAALGVSTAFGLAGCGGDGGSDDEEDEADDETDDEADDETTASEGAMDDGSDSESGSGSGDGSDSGSDGGSGGGDGSVNNELLDGIEVVEHSGQIAEGRDGEDEYQIVMTIRNNGDETFDMIEHDYGVTLYDGSGTELGETSGWVSTSGDPGPGETAEITMSGADLDDPGAVASYEITLTCGSFDEGAYCPDN